MFHRFFFTSVLAVAGLVGDVHASAASVNVQSWPVHPDLGQILLQAEEEFQGLTWEGTLSSTVNTEVSRCHARVAVPTDSFEPHEDPQNRLECNLVGAESPTAGFLRLPLANVAFEFWGNRAERTHRLENDLPLNFQIKDDPMAGAFYGALKKAHEAGSNRVDRMFLCGPYGVLCTESYSLLYRPQADDARAYLSCSRNTENEETYGRRCIFMYPQQR